MAITLKAARINAGLTQAQVCEILKERGLNTAKSTLVSWESEATFPTAIVFRALAEIYGCTMNDISVPDLLTLKKGEE